MSRTIVILSCINFVLHAADPLLTADHIVNAADYHPGPIAPSEVIILYPTDAGPPDLVSWHVDTLHIAQHPSDPVGETRVLFDNQPAPVVYARTGQICTIVPYHVAGQRNTEIVVEYRGRRSPPVTVPVIASTPAIFTLDASGKGQAAMLNDTGCCNGIRNPVARGKDAVLYATGDGLPLPVNGGITATSIPINVTVGGVPAKVLWAGNVGILQINFLVPDTAPVGDAVPLTLTVGGAQTSANVTMAVRSARQQILLVDPDPAERRHLTAMLSPDYEIAIASDASAATRHFDLVIAPLQSLTAAHRPIKIAAIADPRSPDDLRAADLLGAQAILPQPLVAETVRQRVRTLLRRRQAVY
jgi:uncharacterized protein (TIGR03437 family)